MYTNSDSSVNVKYISSQQSLNDFCGLVSVGEDVTVGVGVGHTGPP